jgi:type II secretory pathway pseudopilin PulG
MSKRGTTLIESVVSIFIVSVVLVTFLQSLNVAMTGTLQLDRKTSALNQAKSQIEYTKAQNYNASTGDINVVYGNISPNLSDIINYSINGRIDNTSVSQYLQLISVNVSYLQGRQVELTGYKLADGSLIEPTTRGFLVTDNIKNSPTLPQGYGGLCLGTFRGFYHVFTTGIEGPASVHWKFNWNEVSGGSVDIGCPVIAVYEGVPNWVKRDSEDQVREDGTIVRQQNGLWLFDAAGIGDLPGIGNGNVMCQPCTDAYYDPDTEENPLYYKPTSHIYWLENFFTVFVPCGLGGYIVNHGYPCCGYSSPHEIFWSYDTSGSSGTAEDSLVTGNLDPGTYTVLFFNSENQKNLDTISASVTYWK